MQKGRGGGLSGAFAGGMASGLLGSKTGDFLTWVTVVCVSVFLLLAVLMARYYRPSSRYGHTTTTQQPVPGGQTSAPQPGATQPTPPPAGTSEQPVPAAPSSAAPQPAAPASQPATAQPSTSGPSTAPAPGADTGKSGG
jgi:preprotein translocase subunit SecG